MRTLRLIAAALQGALLGAAAVLTLTTVVQLPLSYRLPLAALLIAGGLVVYSTQRRS
jgi:hypothetical protein